MTILERMFPGLATAAAVETYQARAVETVTYSEYPLPYSYDVHPPSRLAPARYVSLDDATTLPSVYRALDVINTSTQQIPLYVERAGRRVSLEDLRPDDLMRKPNVDMDPSEFAAALVLCLAARGNAYVRKVYTGPRGRQKLTNLEVLNPAGVRIGKESGRTVYYHDGKTYSAADVVHIWRLKLPGATYGLGPIQAAQPALRLGLDEQGFAGNWFDTTGEPSGILKSDQALTAADAKQARRAWNGLDPETGQPLPPDDNPTRIKVLGKGLAYESQLISPKDALWLDAQSFSVLEVARLFGIPTSLMYASLDGGSMTYQNVQQELTTFATYTLMGYLRPIENALSRLTPAGQRVRFNVDALLRADTTTRYAAHEAGIRAGWLHPDEARDMEGRPPLTPEQRATMPKTTPAAPAATENAA